VGYRVTSQSFQEGFLLDGEVFSVIQVPGFDNTHPRGLNNQDVIVGSFYGASEDQQHGFVHSHGHFTTLDYPGASSTIIYGINDAGVLVGVFKQGPEDFFGTSFSAVPVPEPSTWGLMAIGIAALAWRASKAASARQGQSRFSVS